MILVDEKAGNCCGCSACQSICPKSCIDMIQDQEGFYYPKVDRSNCTNCGMCEKVCPFNNDNTETIENRKSFAMNSKNLEEREFSSSGGVFSLLADEVLCKNGIVYGAVMSEDNKTLYHLGIDNKKDFVKLRGSKYLQSDMKNCYKEIKHNLEQNIDVLFSGTPCQVEGLKKYLGKEYDGLFTVDIVCHGVPSPLLWKKYIENSESEKKSSVKDVNFRSKKIGWSYYGMLKHFDDGDEEFDIFERNPFMKIFLKNICLRPSCYNCKTKCIGDISLGDLWGIDNIAPKLNDDRGTSLVIINSEKGLKFLEKIKIFTEFEEIDFHKAVDRNPCVLHSIEKPIQRDYFMKDMNLLSFNELEKKYVREPFSVRLTQRIKEVLKKILRYNK